MPQPVVVNPAVLQTYIHTVRHVQRVQGILLRANIEKSAVFQQNPAALIDGNTGNGAIIYIRILQGQIPNQPAVQPHRAAAKQAHIL